MATTLPSPAPAADFITVLKSAGPKLTKIFDGDQVIPYADAKHFSIETLPINGIDDLSMHLLHLATKTLRCVIRGKFKGDAAAQTIAPPTRPGLYRRIGELFDEVPHFWWCADHDDFAPMLWDPVTDPEGAIRELIEDRYPSEFHNASYHWQLSSSAGRKPGVLKVHIWWPLATAYTGPQVEAWVRTIGLKTDVTTLRKVQPHYVANPVFQNGAVDPTGGKRGGLYRGEVDAVPLVIPEEVLAQAGEKERAAGGADPECPDPTQKPGVIGAFCQAYPISRVIHEILPDVFEYAPGDDRRVTWHGGGGAVEGCWVTDDDWYLGNSHNTSPHELRLQNAWDVVRIYKFGHLDSALTLDEQALAGIGDLPSQRAMREWVEALPEIKGLVSATAKTAREGFLAGIREAADERALREVVLPAIAREVGLAKADKDILIAAIQQRLREFTGVRVTVAIARSLLRDAGRDVDRTETPFWARSFVYVTNGDLFFNLNTKEPMTSAGFNASFNRYMLPFVSEDGAVPLAARHACDVWHLDCVCNVVYNPTLPRTFELGGRMYANTYSDANIPAVPPVLTDAEEAAWALVLEHLHRMFPDPREARLYLDWLAHNVQFPGKKIRWSPYVWGAQRVGKSFFHNLLEAAMGPDNVCPLAAEELIKSNFNEYANGAAVVFIEEIKVPDVSARETETKLKPLITNDSIRIVPKGRASYKTINVTNYAMFSNFPDGYPLDGDDCRVFVLKAQISREAGETLRAEGYYRRLFDALKNGGAMRKKLLEHSLSEEFSADSQAPWTGAKDAVIDLCKSDAAIALEDILRDGARGITADVVSAAHLTAAIAEKTGAPIRTRALHSLLTRSGFEFCDRFRWDKTPRRIWVRTESELFGTLFGTFGAFGTHSHIAKAAVAKKLREILDSSADSPDFLA